MLESSAFTSTLQVRCPQNSSLKQVLYLSRTEMVYILKLVRISKVPDGKRIDSLKFLPISAKYSFVHLFVQKLVSQFLKYFNQI